METRVMEVVSSLEVGINEVRMIGIKGMGGAGKTTTARAVFDYLSADFEAKSFVENVREVSNGSMFGLKKLQEQVLSKVLNEHVTLDSVTDGKNMMKERMCGKKVLLVLDDVDHIDQLKALAGEPKWFKPGSRILITTRDEQVLVAHRVNVIRDIVLLSKQDAISLFSRYAFGRENPLEGYEELSGKVVRYAVGLPLTVEIMGSFLCGKDKLEWVDAIDRLEKIPLKDTLEKLELSYISLEDEYKEIFLDIACILKGEDNEGAIRILESCGFHARIGLKVLEQRSLITISKYGELGMHDHIEEMGKNIVHRSHPDEPNKHSHMWIDEEIEDILANDMGTEATRCLKLNISRGNERIFMQGLGKMKKLRYLEVNFADYDMGTIPTRCLNLYGPRVNEIIVMKGLGKMKKLRCLEVIEDSECESDGECFVCNPKFDNTSQFDIPNSLKYLKCIHYPFLYLPKTFQANNLVGLEMESSRRMVQLREEGEKKVLKKLKFLSLLNTHLTTFDFRITPNLETLFLSVSPNLVELFMPVSCRKLNYLHINYTNLRTFDLGLTPNLERLFISSCADFVELHVSAACPNLKFLDLPGSRLRSLDLELIPNLERLDLAGCDMLVEINAPVGCLKKVGYLNLTGCLRFPQFVFIGGSEPSQVSRSSATLDLVGEYLDSCPLHPNSNLPKLRFRCNYEENLPSSVGNIEKLISFGLCACTDLKKFSDIICSLRYIKKLELDCDIPEFPKDLGQLACLEELWLSSTKIKHLPDSICKLRRLESLEVYNCDHLEKLPEDLGQLKRLKELYVTECCLGNFPEDIGQLESLERLDLWGTTIKHLPDSVCMLKHLKYLNLHHCTLLEKLPEDLVQLECLETLKVSSVKIEYLPDSICMLKHLKYLNLHRCALFEKLPEDLGRLECLETLKVSSVKIEYLPDSICMLKTLKELYVYCRHLGKLPEDIGQLESLERLDLWGTTIKHLPDSFCMLKHLKYLNLHRCALLEKLPEDLGQLECLEMLKVSSKKIEYLPDSICMLKHLKYLYLHRCALLEKLPEDLGQLECLEMLKVSSEKIEYLPDSICMLKHLKYLYLHSCALFEKLPEDLGRLECLKKLDITHTGISHLPQSIFGIKGLLIAAPQKLLWLYDFPSEIKTTYFSISI